MTVNLRAALLAQPGWSHSFYVNAYQNLVVSGGRKIAGPLLVLQGEAEPSAPFPITTAAVSETCDLFPNSQLEYLTFANVTHVPVTYATQRIWLRWIEDRFAGVAVPKGCQRTNFTSARPYQYYQAETNWFIEYALKGYETA
jgi:hypothetical protein